MEKNPDRVGEALDMAGLNGTAPQASFVYLINIYAIPIIIGVKINV